LLWAITYWAHGTRQNCRQFFHLVQKVAKHYSGKIKEHLLELPKLKMILQVVGCISRGVSQAKKYLSLSFLRPEAERAIEHYDLHETTFFGRIFILSLLPVLNPTHLVPCNLSLPSFFLCLTVLTLSLLRDNFDLLDIHSGFFSPYFLG